MSQEFLRFIKSDTIVQDGFAGIVEKRMLMSPKIWPQVSGNHSISHGLKDFIYLSSGYFKANDGAPLHPHRDVDIVSVIHSGSVGHKGSLGDGSVIHSPGVQVQRAGTGMQHSEFSIDDHQAEFTQLWFAPPKDALTPYHQNFSLKEGELVTVLGGGDEHSFESNMTCEVGFIANGEKLTVDDEFILFITRGQGKVNGREVEKGDLVEGKRLVLLGVSDLGIILVRNAQERP